MSEVKKDKMISVKVNSEIWQQFKEITGKYGSTANGMVNQLITEYVYNKGKELKDLDAM